jgi:hypothetical protein
MKFRAVVSEEKRALLSRETGRINNVLDIFTARMSFIHMKVK